MMYVFFTGRIGRDAEIVSGSFGTFMSMDLAVEEYEKGETVTAWVKVKSQLPQLMNLSKYLKKGKIVVVEGILKKPNSWNDKDGNLHIQQNITASSIQFLNTGKKKEGEQINEGQLPTNNGDSSPSNPTPFEEPSDLPF